MVIARSESQCLRTSIEHPRAVGRRGQEPELHNASISRFPALFSSHPFPAPSISTSPSRLSPARRALVSAAPVARRRLEFEALTSCVATSASRDSIHTSTPRSPLGPVSTNIPLKISQSPPFCSLPDTPYDDTINTPGSSGESSTIQIPGSFDPTPRVSRLVGPSKRAARRVRKSISVPSIEFKESLDNVLNRVKSAFLTKRSSLLGNESNTSLGENKVRQLDRGRVKTLTL